MIKLLWVMAALLACASSFASDRPFGPSTVDLWLRRLKLSYKRNAARRRATARGRFRLQFLVPARFLSGHVRALLLGGVPRFFIAQLQPPQP